MAADMVLVDLKGTEEAMAAPGAHQLPAMAGGGEKVLLIGDPSRLLPVKHMPDLEKGIKEGMDAQAGQVPAVAEDEEQEHLILKNLRYHQVEEGAVAGKMNPGQKKWLPYWLLVSAASVIFLNNHIHAAPKEQLFLPELAMFAVLLCAICLIILSMKQMM